MKYSHAFNNYRFSDRAADVAVRNRDIYHDRHWEYWIGPKAEEASLAGIQINQAIERIFQSDNLVGQCIDRHLDALIGGLPNWWIKDLEGNRIDTTDNDGNPIDSPASAAERVLQLWLDRIVSLSISQESQLEMHPFRQAAMNMAIEGTGYLRVWAPRRFANSDDITRRVALHAPDPSAIEYQYDLDGFLDKILYRYTIDDRPFTEAQWIDPETNETVFQTLDQSNRPIADESGQTEFRFDLGGVYTVQAMRSPSLITESAVKQQNALNYVLTMLMRNNEQAGFLERIVTGGLPPGEWREIDGDRVFVPADDLQVGPGKTTFVQGVPIFDENGNVTGYTSPAIAYRDPVNVESFERSKMIFLSGIYQQFGQGHLLATDLNMSGIARVQSRQDFNTRLERHRLPLQSAIAGILKATLMLMVADQQLEQNQYSTLNFAVQLSMTTSQPLPEELDQNRADYQAGLKSRTSAIAATGISDPDAEVALIDRERMESEALTTASTLSTLGIQDSRQTIALLQQLRAVPPETTAIDPDLPLN